MPTAPSNPRIHLISLGCPKNLVDGEHMVGALEANGYVLAERPEQADLILVNTCGFIDPAKEESIETILEAARFKEMGTCKAVIVTGCLSQRYREELTRDLPEADAFLGLDDRDRIVETCDRILGRTSQGHPCVDHRHRMTPPYMAYLRIADGCDNRCAYCTIPMIRGGYRSEPMEKLIAEARDLADQGVRELNLVAQDTTQYGWDVYGERRLPELLDRLCTIEPFKWIRLLYTHPAHLTEGVIEALARNERMCRYIDLPIQHISDVLLGRMNRRVTGQQIRRLIERLRDRIPGIAIRTSLIVGLPGETDEHFEELLEFVEETRFERLGAFTYSQEEGTPAARWENQVPEEVKQERLDRVMTLQGEISLRLNEDRIGRQVEVLVEGPDEDGVARWVGRTEWDASEIDARVLIREGDAPIGAFVEVEITDVEEYDVYGKIL